MARRGGWGSTYSDYGRRPTTSTTRTTPRRRTTPRGAPTGLTPGSVLSGAGSNITQPYFQDYWGRPGAGETGTTAEAQGVRAAYRDIFGPYTGGVPAAPGGSGGGGGRGYGGGGGGGGGSALTQAMLNSMLGALGTMGPALALQRADLPDFRGQNLPAFSAAPYEQATQQLNQAVQADLAAAQQAATQATQALQANYTNAYANAPVQATPAAPQVGVALQGTVGGGGDQAAVAAESNAAAQSDQASFANLLNVLAAADQTAQASRLNQVALDQGTAANAIRAQQRGLLGGVNMARTRAFEQWRQQDAERRYQNALMQQQWQREELMRNQDITNQQAQGNWQQRNEMIANRMGPLLELLTAAGGSGLNTNALQQLLAGWSR